jgi:hypothetical protein
MQKKVSKTPIFPNKLGVVVYDWAPSYMRGIGRTIALKLALGKNMRPYLGK